MMMNVKIRIFALLLLFVVNQKAQNRKTEDPRYTSLRLYQGAWNIVRKSGDATAKPDRLVNDCALMGQYFACAQSVNGSAGGLIVFIPSQKTGSYYTQTITTDGRATGRADLVISGDQWTYSSRWPQESGKIVYYRTTNVFTGKNRIHFEQLESADGTHWTLKQAGDEVRADFRGH